MLSLPRLRVGSGVAYLRAILTLSLPSCVLLSGLLSPGAPAEGSTRQPDETYTLTAGGRVERKLSPGEAHVYLITINENQYVRMLIEHSGMTAGGSLCAPHGHDCVQFDSRHAETVPLSLITRGAGDYRLEVRSAREDDGAGSYVVRIEAIRPVAAADEKRIAAERAYAEGERLSADWTPESFRRAVEQYELALALWSGIGERRAEAAAQRRIADVLHSLNESQRALEYYRAALALARNADDRWGEAEALNGIGEMHLTLGESQRAFEYFNRALKVSRGARIRGGEAQAVNNLGEAYYALGDMRRSLDFCLDALALWRDLGDRRGQALALLNAGYVHSNLSNVQDAMNAFDQSIRLWRSVKNRWGEAHTLTAVGHLKSKLGEKQEALDLYRRARPLFQTMGDYAGEAFVLNGMGYVNDELGEKETALSYHEEAQRLFASANYRDGEAGALLRMGEIHYSLKNAQRALELFQQSLAMYKAAGIRLYESYILRDIGMVHESLGERAKALHYYQQALALNRTRPDRRWQAHAHNNIARVYEDSGDVRRALGSYQRALSLNRATGDRFGETMTLYNLARLERDAGNLDDARAHIQEALLVAESLRANVASQTLRASYFASARQYYELYIDVLMRLHRQRPGERLDVAAFEVSENARARSLLETLKEARADIRRGADPALLERQRSLQQELNAKAERRMQLPADQQGTTEAVALTKEIDKLTLEYDEVSSQIKTSNPRYASLMHPQPLNLGEIRQQIIDDDSLLLEYFLGEQRSYLWAVTSTEITTYELPPRAEIEGMAHRVYELLTTRQGAIVGDPEQRRARTSEADRLYWQEASALSQIVLGPMAKSPKTKRLLIIADGALQYIPFQALPSPTSREHTGHQTEGGNVAADEPLPLVAIYEVVNQSSASSLVALRDETDHRPPAPKALAILADPVFEKDDPRMPSASGSEAASALPETELSRAMGDVGTRSGEGGIPRLFASQAEAEAIANVAHQGEVFKALGFDASRSTIMNTSLGQYRIVHFATHGILDSKHPELSGVVLSLFDREGRRQDGFLRLHDIYNLNLPVDLVVLSACNTGLGKDVRGEGLIGLTRGFMYAGSASVVASLWKVDDRATSELMAHFYQGMLNKGLPPAAALREAQLAMWKQKRWHSPYYWAAFTLHGEYRMRVNDGLHAQGGTRPSYFAVASASVLILSIGILALIKRRGGFRL